MWQAQFCWQIMYTVILFRALICHTNQPIHRFPYRFPAELNDSQGMKTRNEDIHGSKMRSRLRSITPAVCRRDPLEPPLDPPLQKQTKRKSKSGVRKYNIDLWIHNKATQCWPVDPPQSHARLPWQNLRCKSVEFRVQFLQSDWTRCRNISTDHCKRHKQSKYKMRRKNRDSLQQDYPKAMHSFTGNGFRISIFHQRQADSVWKLFLYSIDCNPSLCHFRDEMDLKKASMTEADTCDCIDHESNRIRCMNTSSSDQIYRILSLLNIKPTKRRFTPTSWDCSGKITIKWEIRRHYPESSLIFRKPVERNHRRVPMLTTF